MRGTAWLALLALACVSPGPEAPVVPAWDQAGAAAIVADDERALWHESTRIFEAFMKENADALVVDPTLDPYLNDVLESLVPATVPAAMPRPRALVLRSADRNAYAAPEGLVIVSSGFLAALGDEAQLAGLFGHELAHVLGRHALIEERYGKLTASTVRRMELSRAQEEEADRRGLALMQWAGYDPRGILEMLGILESDGSAVHRGYPKFESHPFISERMRSLRSEPGAVMEGRRETARYEAAIAELLLVDAELELEAGKLDRARTAIDRHLRLRPESGRGYYWKAEHERRVAKEGRLAPSARRAYEHAVEFAPDDPDALRALGFLYREVGETERAREMLGHYLSVAPDAADRRLIERYLAEAAARSEADGAVP